MKNHSEAIVCTGRNKSKNITLMFSLADKIKKNEMRHSFFLDNNLGADNRAGFLYHLERPQYLMFHRE